MHSPDRILNDLREQSVAMCAASFAARPQSRPLTGPELREDAGRLGADIVFTAGWETGGSDSDPSTRLHVLLDERTPFSTPQFLLQGELRFGIWPHVERTNRLCVIPQPDTHTYTDCSGLVTHLLAKAKELVQHGQTGANHAEFIEELESYWVTHAHTLSVNITDPLRPAGLVVRRKGNLFFACNEQQAEGWFQRLGIPDPQSGMAGAYIPLDAPILPKDFPSTVDGLRKLLELRGHTDPLKAVSHEEVTPFFYVLGVPRGGDAVPSHIYLGIRLDAPPAQVPQSISHNRHARAPRLEQRTRGFRPGKLKAPYDLRRSFPGSQELPRINIQRCDATWIHTRGGAGGQLLLGTKKVIIIGCGSLGSSVASLLAKAGVGTMALIDPDKLSWDNVARHENGGLAEIGLRKNQALAADLSRRFPHLAIEGSAVSEWRQNYDAHPERRSAADLILTTTGSWASDSQLNVVHRHGGVITCPVIYGFLEAHAAAGQAITVETTGPCYQCGVNLVGYIHRAAFEWATSPLKQAPACGAFYQPYGAADIAPTARLIANAAVARLLGGQPASPRAVWIGDTAQAIRLGAALNSTSGVPEAEVRAGNRQLACDWPALSTCPACGSQPQ